MLPFFCRVSSSGDAVLILRCFCILAGSWLGSLARLEAAAPSVQSLVDEFSPANYLNIVSNTLYTRQGMNRVPVELGGAQHDLCRDAIYDELLHVGLEPYKDPWSYVDTTNNTLVNVCNLIALKPGVQNTNNEIYIVGSHYDSKNNPGADDNATGVACQLEMARIFARYHFKKTIVFALFDAEERWEAGTGAHRLGSLRYVAQHGGDNIKGMISVDMIGWQAPPPNHDRASIRGRAGFDAIRLDLQSAIATYGQGLQGIISTSTDNMSDNYSFAQAGIPACCLIEYNYSSNPYYHKSTDYVEQPNYLDWGYLAKMCKSVIGYYATKLEPVDVTPRATGIGPGPGEAMVVAFRGLAGCKYATEIATNLSSAFWTALETNTATSDGTFSTLDSQAWQRPRGFYRARFVAGADPLAISDIVIDNTQAAVVGTWESGTSAQNKYGVNYRYKFPGSGAAYLEYRPALQRTGNYEVYEWHPHGTNRPTNAPVEITYNGGAQTVRINQQINGGQWNLVGTFPFAQGTASYVRITDDFTNAAQVVMADAVKFVHVP